MTVEVRFLSPGWKEHDQLVKETELVPPDFANAGRMFWRGSKRFSVTCKLQDDGGKILGWDLDTHIDIYIRRDESRLDGQGEGWVFSTGLHTRAEIEQGGSARLTIDEEPVAEITHISAAEHR